MQHRHHYLVLELPDISGTASHYTRTGNAVDDGLQRLSLGLWSQSIAIQHFHQKTSWTSHVIYSTYSLLTTPHLQQLTCHSELWLRILQQASAVSKSSVNHTN